MAKIDTIIFADTEDDSKGNFVFGVAKKNNEYYSFRNKHDMKKFLTLENSTIYFHNAQYDIGNIFDISEIEIKMCGSKFISAVYNNNGKYIRIYDSFNLLPLSLRQIGKIFDLDKLDMKKDDLEEYCKRDVDILEKFVKSVFGYCGTLGIKPSSTLSGISWNYLKKLNPDENFILRDEFYDARDSFFGGRVEIFNFYNGKNYEHDVNSMYPSVMKEGVFPNWHSLKRGKILDLSKEGYAKVIIDSRDFDFPILPLRKNGKIYFPNGKFVGTYTVPELRYFVENGGKILDVEYAVLSRDIKTGIFSEFVEDLYKKKNESDGGLKLFYKLLLNSLYGKFAFRGEVEEISDDGDMNKGFEIENGRVMVFRKKLIRTNYMNILIASYITSYARIKLHNYIMKSKNPIYCDTDSVISSDKIAEKNEVLGELSLKSVHKNCEFILPKVYRLDDKVKCKGFSNISSDDFEKLKRGETIYRLSPNKIKSFIRYGKKLNVWEKRPKRIVSEYDKRKVFDDGHTEPFNVKELK